MFLCLCEKYSQSAECLISVTVSTHAVRFAVESADTLLSEMQCAISTGTKLVCHLEMQAATIRHSMLYIRSLPNTY